MTRDERAVIEAARKWVNAWQYIYDGTQPTSIEDGALISSVQRLTGGAQADRDWQRVRVGAMRALLLLLIVLLSGCFGTVVNQYHTANTPGYDGRFDGAWYTRNGQAHVPLVLGLTAASQVLTGNPYYGSVAGCAGYAFREYEETRNWRRFEWGKADSIFDVLVPCATGFALPATVKLLRRIL